MNFSLWHIAQFNYAFSWDIDNKSKVYNLPFDNYSWTYLLKFPSFFVPYAKNLFNNVSKRMDMTWLNTYMISPNVGSIVPSKPNLTSLQLVPIQNRLALLPFFNLLYIYTYIYTHIHTYIHIPCLYWLQPKRRRNLRNVEENKESRSKDVGGVGHVCI